MENNRELQLTLWRDCRKRELYYDSCNKCPISTDDLREIIYKWETSDSIHSSIIDANQRDEFEKLLHNKDNDSHRTIQELKKIIIFTDDILKEKDEKKRAKWSSSTIPIKDREDYDINLKINHIIAFRNLLEWILYTFKSIDDVYFEFK